MFEVIGEFIFNILLDQAENKKRPKVLRLLIIALFMGLYIAIIIGVVIISINNYQEGKAADYYWIIMGIILAVLLAFPVYLVRLFIKTIREKNRTQQINEPENKAKPLSK